MKTSLSILNGFLGLFLLSSISVVYCKNPIYSILFLVLSFFNVSGLLFLMQIDFLPISFIVIYVGAIAVLFIFVVMLLNIKYTELKNQDMSYMPFLLLFTFMIFLEIVVFFGQFKNTLSLTTYHANVLSEYYLNTSGVLSSYSSIFKLTNIESVGLALFVGNPFSFVLSGLVLLVSMFGSIALSINKSFSHKTQTVYLQVLSNSKSSLITYS